MGSILLPLLVGHRLHDLLPLLKVLRLGYPPVAPELLQSLKLLGRAARIDRDTVQLGGRNGCWWCQFLPECKNSLAELGIVILLGGRVRLARNPDEADRPGEPGHREPGPTHVEA